MAKSKGKTIWLSDPEYAMFQESKELFRMMTGVKMSNGAYIVALSLGGLAAKSVAGVMMRCSKCGQEVEIRIETPKAKRIRRRQTSE
jgi:hypothetical protein